MTAIVTSNFRTYNAARFKESLGLTGTSNLYLFNGRPQAWTGTSGGDSTPDSPIDSMGALNSVWKDMIAAKKIDPANVATVVVRRNWVSGVYYDMYRSDYNGVDAQGVNAETGDLETRSSLEEANFYVVNPITYSVYKCLDNRKNDGTIGPATVPPSGTGPESYRGSDGYRWQYMYTMSPADVSKFVSVNFMPVQIQSAALTNTDAYYYQWEVQNRNNRITTDGVDQGIEAIVVTSGGTYSSAPNITIIGDGTGATAQAHIFNNQLSYIEITSKGQNYTYANVVITPIGEGGGGIATAMISPRKGHAYNAVEELNGYYVMITARFEYDENGDFPIDNEYRRIGLLVDPTQYASSNLYTGSTACTTNYLQFGVGTITGSFTPDDTITGSPSGATGKVVSWDATNRILKYIKTSTENNIAFSVDDLVSGANGGQGTVEVLGHPEIQPYNGNILYYENRRPIYRAIDQIEDIKIVIEM